MNCSQSGAGRECYDNADRKYDAIHKQQEREFEEACKGGLNSPACVSHRIEVMSGDEAWNKVSPAGLPAVVNKYHTELYDLGCTTVEACRTRMSNFDQINVASYEKRSELIATQIQTAKGWINGIGGNFDRLSDEDKKLAGGYINEVLTSQGRGPGVKDKQSITTKPIPDRNNKLPTFDTGSVNKSKNPVIAKPTTAGNNKPQNIVSKLPVGYVMRDGVVTGPKGGKYNKTDYIYNSQTVYEQNGKHYTFSSGKRESVRLGKKTFIK